MMKQINLSFGRLPSELDLEIQVRRAGLSKVSDQELDALILEINLGRVSAVPILVSVSHELIFTVILRLGDSRFSIDERFEVAAKALKKLALKELNIVSRGLFLRFGAWVVRQSLLGMEC